MKKLTQLKDSGYRLTKPRQELINTLKTYPLTVQDIYKTLRKKGVRIDLVSIYRSLELFKKIGIVTEVELGEGKKRYELTNYDKHHHHFICTNCGSIEDISSNVEKKLIREVQRKFKFIIQSHSLEMFGLCQKCVN